MKSLSRSFFLSSISLVAYFFLFVGSVEANHLCASRAALLKELASEYQEEPTAIGIASDGSVIEILTSQSGSWTIISTTGSVSCLVLGGEGWMMKPISKTKEKNNERDS